MLTHVGLTLRELVGIHYEVYQNCCLKYIVQNLNLGGMKLLSPGNMKDSEMEQWVGWTL